MSELLKNEWPGVQVAKIAPMPVGDSISITESENFVEMYGSGVFFECYNSYAKTAKVYRECPPLSYILNQKALQLTNGKVVCENINTGKEKKGEVGTKWMELINYPNPLQTGTQFLAQTSTFCTLFGFCPVLRVYSTAFEDEGVQQMWILPPHMMKIKVNTNYLYCTSVYDMIDEISFTYQGKTVIVKKEDVYFFTDRTCSIDNLMFPLSRLEAMKYPINNLIKNYESRGVIMERRGALGILSPEPSDAFGQIRAKDEDKKDLQDAYRKYGLAKDQWQIIISTIAMKFQSMTMNMKELMLLEMAEDDIMTLCDALGFKFQLLSRGSKTTFNNQNIAEKAQYQDYTIPEADNLFTQFNDCVNAKDFKIQFRITYDHVACLQADEKEKSFVRRNNVSSITLQFQKGLITYGRAMELLGETDSIPTAWAKLFIWDTTFPEEIKALYQTAPAQENNSSQNQPANE